VTLPPTSFPKSEIKVLLLENVHPSADELFGGEGFQIERVKGALKEAELVERIRDVHILGIRSKTQVTERVLDEARRLLVVGAFCIGTNQIRLSHANKRGVPVFNAPFSNTRSVAEMVIAEVIVLSRQLFDRSREVHEGTWKKIAVGAHEIRGKTLGTATSAGRSACWPRWSACRWSFTTSRRGCRWATTGCWPASRICWRRRTS